MRPEGAQGPGPPLRAILIVEDNQVNALILRSMLRKRGYDTMVASDGVEGVAMSDRHHPLLVLIDLQMPRLDGFAAAAEIRRQPGAKPTIVAVTANAGTDVQDACEAAGFACVLAKPVVYDELIATVRRFLGVD